ncbi:LysR family transcriptional regulator [Beijerinckia indica]|uniref:Transcriptional regulator, LysR family n=1 Tax=Beijerinckia indica subsp. indica (strain ATCC 9039 / DSM 1715 / NCIMB 8712) TaxID=395963 RepID=B2IDM3_BEII9|nr:LysR family transcriptional regulator [Beijerinckia indica]ACB95459.1 transcriptional regulator, LysR family [Beijerinckia indica subsp. indica ATCC 9039]
MDRLLAIETFVRVVDTGSFSAAARIQNIGQPTVSKAIAQLEDWLGVRLLLRSTRGLAPTEAGMSFYERARRAIEEADEAVLAARGTAAGLSGRVRVSAAVCFARLHIVPKLPAFLATHPNVEVDLLLEDRNIDLVAEGVDVALRMGPLTDPGMTVRKIAERRRLVMATPEYFERYGKPETPSDLIGHQAVIYTRDNGGEDFTFTRNTEQTSIGLSGRVRISATEGLRAAVLAGIGLTIASEFAFSPELKTGEVVTALDDWTLPAISLSAVYPTGRMASTKARAFVSFVEECLKN